MKRIKFKSKLGEYKDLFDESLSKEDILNIFIADGNMGDIMLKVEAGHYDKNLKKFHVDIHFEEYKKYVPLELSLEILKLTGRR